MVPYGVATGEITSVRGHGANTEKGIGEEEEGKRGERERE